MSKILLPSNMGLPYDKDFYKDYGIFVKPIDYPMSTRKIESLMEISKMQKYFQCNPLKWIDLMYNMEMLDCQALIIQRAWNCPNVLVTASRGIGKSTTIDVILMSKDSLFSNYWCYIASGSGDQAQQTFMTLEKLANDNIDEFQGSTGKLFKDEVVIPSASGDGFSHNPNGFTYSTYNGSTTKTLNSNIDSRRGARGSVIFDESAFLSEEMINVYSAFTIVNKSFKTGKDSSGKSIDPIRQRTFATNIPNQKFLISSASTTDTKYYALYRDWSKRQIMGDPDYCVLHIDCEVAFKPTLHGKIIAPLLSRSTVESEMRTNPEKARREYYCQFTTEAGSDAIVKRGVITRNEEIRKPIHCNETGNKKYGLFYDPARQMDNSFILVMEFYDYIQKDGTIDKRAKIVNGVNLLDVGKKIKSPMRTPDQVEYLKQMILDYNAGADNYENIVGIWIDAGSGGGGINIADYLMPDWETADGMVHRGLIDKEFSSDYVSRFPNAVDKIHLMSPSKYKSEMYEALIEMLTQDKISFTATYDNKEYLTIFDIDQKKLAKERERITEELKKKKLNEKEFEEKMQEELGKIQSVNTKTIKLDWKDKIALANIDALKEEIVNMVRKKRESGKDSFELTPEKARSLHDDRAYTLALGGYALMEERRKLLLQKPKVNSNDLLNKLRSQIRGGLATKK